MYKDFIVYELAEGISEEQLLSVATRIINEWMKNLKGFQTWEIHKMNDESYTDIVCWDSKDDAKAAEAEMMKIPNAIEWFNCYKEGTIKGSGATLLASF